MQSLGRPARSQCIGHSCAQQLHRIHRFGLQLEEIVVDCNAAEKALLADVMEAHPDASYIELLRLFKVRRSVADGHS